MKIGIIGTRGIPNKYGGYEQFAEYAAPELVKRGHEVTVYNSSLHGYEGSEWNGVHIITKSDIEDKIGTAGQFIYDLNCILDTRKRDFDVILQLGYTSSSSWSFLFPRKSIVVTNMDGLEWKRSKYSPATQRFLKQAEKWAALKSDLLISDSIGIKSYLFNKYKKQSEYIAYGAEVITEVNDHYLKEKDLQPYKYNLVIARLEPENNVEMIIKGHIESNYSQPLIIIGGVQNKFGKYLLSQYASENIRFWGAVYDIDLLNSLRYFSNIYFHGHSVGGTNPSLLEAMASSALIASHDNVFNKSILGNDAFYFSSENEIKEILQNFTKKEDFLLNIEENIKKIENDFSWSHIIDLLENYFIYGIENKK